MKTTSFAIDPVDTAAESDMETQPRAVRQSRQREKIDEIVDKVVGKDLEWLNKKLISPGDPEYIRCVNQKDKYVSYVIHVHSLWRLIESNMISDSLP
jgi:hypothetical protein